MFPPIMFPSIVLSVPINVYFGTLVPFLLVTIASPLYPNGESDVPDSPAFPFMHILVFTKCFSPSMSSTFYIY